MTVNIIKIAQTKGDCSRKSSGVIVARARVRMRQLFPRRTEKDLAVEGNLVEHRGCRP